MHPQPLHPQDRERILSETLAAEVGRGARVESHGANMGVVVYGKQPNHVLHAILTLFTCFAWAFVWLVIGLTVKERRMSVFVDDWGNIRRQ